jgi:putative ABC transport system permease protein
MSYFDLLKETLVALTSNITRTLLTMLGIVIGISSVIAMVSIGQGAQASITSSITSLGSKPGYGIPWSSARARISAKRRSW